MRFSYTDIGTGQSKEGFINYDTNFRYTINELERDALTDIQERYPYLQGTIESIRVWKGFKREE